MELDLTQLTHELERYQSLIDADPKNHQLWFMLAQIYQRKHQIENAVNAYEQALDLEELPEYLFRLGEMYFDLKEFSKALECLLKVLDKVDKDWKYYEETVYLIDELYTNDSCCW